MQYQIPDGVYCPLWRKPAKKVCPTCRWFKLVRGRNPNTGEDIDQWDCAISFMPMLQIEMASAARSGAAATESFRNEMTRRADNAAAAQQHLALRRANNGLQPPLLIDSE